MKPSLPVFTVLLCVAAGCSDSNGPASGIGGNMGIGGNTTSGGSLALSGVGGSAIGGDRPLTGGAPGSTSGGVSSATGGVAQGSTTGGSAASTGDKGGGNTGAGSPAAGGGTTTANTSAGAGGSSTKANGGAPPGGSSAPQGGSTTTGTGGVSSGASQTGGRSSGTGGTSAVQGGAMASGGTSAQQSTQVHTGGSGACDSSISERNRTLVSKAIDELFVSKDITAADRYWSDPYLQHNPIAKSGVSTFRSLMGSLISSASFTYQRYLTLAECDLAVVYGRYSQSGVIFDMFRVKDDKIIEHWDSDSNQASETSQVGALDANAPGATHRQLFLDLAAFVLVGAERSRVGEFLSTGYVDHRNTGTTGPTALATMLTSENIVYTRVHHVIADGNFVFALSEGKRGSTSYGFYDLFRAESGLFVERWDSRRSVPSSTASGLGIF